MESLKVKAAGKALVPDYEALDNGLLRFIGRRHDVSVGANGGWIPTDETVVVPHRAEYLQELKVGALEPADEKTAKLAGLAFKNE